MFDDLLEERLRSSPPSGGRRAQPVRYGGRTRAPADSPIGGLERRSGPRCLPPRSGSSRWARSSGRRRRGSARRRTRARRQRVRGRPTLLRCRRCPSASPEPIAPATPAGRAPIVRYLTRDWHAFEIAVDGTGRRAVPTFDIDPELGVLPEDPWPRDRSVSPDGRLAVTVKGDEVRVRSIDANASDTTFTFPLGDSPGETRISWSPDGRHLAVWSEGNGPIAPHSMWVVDVATGRTTAGPVDTIGFINAAWSPDGARIADGGREGLYVVTASTGETQVLRLGADVSGYTDLQWAPDGRWLVFSPATVAYEVHRLNPEHDGKQAAGVGCRSAMGAGRIEDLLPPRIGRGRAKHPGLAGISRSGRCARTDPTSARSFEALPVHAACNCHRTVNG